MEIQADFSGGNPTPENDCPLLSISIALIIRDV